MSDLVKLIRQRNYEIVRELGRGACGATVLLHDPTIDQHFVCKKFAPMDGLPRQELFEKFVQEVKLLLRLHHFNVVRVFGHFLYPDDCAGYILMEFVEGVDIQDYLRAHPEEFGRIFRQVVNGFYHLEENGILHRDIRPANILVSATGVVKIIDLGFGKKVETETDFGKSISLNRWCEAPDEYRDGLYDFSTEVYFVGQLFKKLLRESGLEDFQYLGLLKQMCVANPSQRIASFRKVRQAVLAAGFDDIPFTDREITTYREFRTALWDAINQIEKDAKYIDDLERVQKALEGVYRNTMLEEYLPTNNLLVNCFIDGEYYYCDLEPVPVSLVKAFLDLFRAHSRDRRQIILSNLYTKLDALERYGEKKSDEKAGGQDYDFEDIPF